MIERIRLYLVLCLLVPFTLLLAPIQILVLKFSPSLSRKIPILWHRIATKLVGLKITVKGTVPKDRPTLIVANHISWTDIPVLGSITELCFIAKNEVNDLAGANILARMQRTVFIAREARREVTCQAQEVTSRLLAGDTMVLFAEGTTHDGNRVGDFKSALLGAAQFAVKSGDVEKVFVQPVSIAYTNLHGMPMGRHTRAQATWTGETTLAPHAWNIMRKGAWDVEVVFGEPIHFDETSSRRKVTDEARQQVREMFVKSLHKSDDALISME